MLQLPLKHKYFGDMKKTITNKFVLAAWLLLVTSAIIGVTYLSNQRSAAAALPLASTPFVVNSIGNTADASGGTGACDTGNTVTLPDTSIVPECTLTAAVQSANANNNTTERDVINFAIPGTGIHTITPNASYSLEEPIYINGYSQDGATANTQTWPNPFDGVLTVEINGSAMGGGSASILSVNSSDVTIQGLVLNNSVGNAVWSYDNNNNIEIYGNYLGTDTTGLIPQYNIGPPILFSGASGASTNITIGGTDPAKRNLIAANLASIYSVLADVTIQGNYIGVGSDGITTLPASAFVNTQTIGITGGTVEVGGTTTGAGNSIENNTAWGAISLYNTTQASVLGNRLTGNASGVQVSGVNPDLKIGDGTTAGRNIISGNNLVDQYGDRSSAIGFFDASGNMSVKGNYIGVDDDGTTAFANGVDGITLYGDSTGVTIGGTQPGDANIIANSPRDGIRLGGNSQATILGNSIYSNGSLGINLGDDGNTANDALDADTGANDLLNKPDINSALTAGSDTDINYDVDLPAGDYRIEFFDNTAADSSGYGEGKTLIGVDTLTSTGAGGQQFTSTVTGNSFSFISATVTVVDGGFGPTSEFSNTVAQGTTAPGDYETEVTKTIVDADSLVNDGTIAYQITYTNTGADPFDISTLDASGGDPYSTALFSDVAPAELTFVNATGDVSCLAPQAATGYGTLFSGHSTANVISCGYNGSSPRLLAQNESISFTLNFTRSNSNPGNYVFTNNVVSIPPPGDANVTAYEDAVTSGNDIITELGTSINNLDSITTTKPQADVSVSKLLTNPQDTAPGATLNYTLSYLNNGPAAVDPTEFDGSGVFLMYDFVPPELTPQNLGGEGPFPGTSIITNLGNPDVTCFWGPHGTAVMAGATNHATYGVIICLYSGSSHSLASGSSLDVSLSFTVDSGSDLTFKSYSIANPSFLKTIDPNQADMEAVFGSGNDIIDEFTQNYPDVNNFSTEQLPADLNITSTVVDPSTVTPNGTIAYDVTIDNQGPAPVDLNLASGIGSLITFVYPGDDLTLVGSSTPGISCGSAGPGSISNLGAAGEDHTGYQLGGCIYSGNDNILAAGQSRVVRLTFTIGATPPSPLISYFINVSDSYDPDIPELIGAIFGADHDVLDTISSPNYARVSTALASGSGVNNGSNSGNSGGLSSTGQNIWFYLAGAIILLTGGVILTTKAKGLKKKQS